jgi:hypothetical protein
MAIIAWTITNAQNTHQILQCVLKKRLYFSLFVNLRVNSHPGIQRQEKNISKPTIRVRIPKMVISHGAIE